MSFRNHIFISYAHLDNRPLSKDQDGWITRFHSALEGVLSTRLGEDAKIWRDPKLGGMDVFGDEILEQLHDSALLVSVITPRYLNSEWCPRELNEFCQSAEEHGGLVRSNKARVVKVIKTPVDTQSGLPSIVEKLLGYEFFTFLDDAPLELDPDLDPDLRAEYYRKMVKLAWDITQVLGSLTDPGEDPPGSARPSIYLAECSHDMSGARENLAAELQHLGYPVLPNKQMPATSDEYAAEVEEMMAGCPLAIHLVGKYLGAVPDGTTLRSATMLQNEAAVKRCRANGLQRLIWLPADTASEQPNQKNFIEALHQNAELQFGADLITGSLQDLKASVLVALKKLEEPGEPSARGRDSGAAGKSVYLICVEDDRQAIHPLRKYCRELELQVRIPAFQGDAPAIRKAHQQALTDCDAVLIYYGAGDEAWKRIIESDLMKLPGYRKDKPLLTSFTYLAEPKTFDKEDLIEMEEPNLIDGLDGFEESNMKAFLDAMQSAESHQ